MGITTACILSLFPFIHRKESATVLFASTWQRIRGNQCKCRLREYRCLRGWVTCIMQSWPHALSLYLARIDSWIKVSSSLCRSMVGAPSSCRLQVRVVAAGQVITTITLATPILLVFCPTTVHHLLALQPSTPPTLSHTSSTAILVLVNTHTHSHIHKYLAIIAHDHLYNLNMTCYNLQETCYTNIDTRS